MFSIKQSVALMLVGALTAAGLLLVPRPAAAHGEEPRLEISPEALRPGMVLQVRGVGFEFEEQVSLALAGGASTIPLEPAVGNAEGVFLLLITIPTELVEGTYHIHASTDDHEVDSPQFLVSGPAVVPDQGGGQGSRDEDDGLLAAMPTYAPGVSVTPMPISQPHVEPELEETVMFLAIGVLALVGILITLAMRGRRAG